METEIVKFNYLGMMLQSTETSGLPPIGLFWDPESSSSLPPLEAFPFRTESALPVIKRERIDLEEFETSSNENFEARRRRAKRRIRAGRRARKIRAKRRSTSKPEISPSFVSLEVILSEIPL